ncbi:MAG: hypothetical protein ACI8U4_003131 [Natronomonas sp.]|jgi:hypothetical protein
MIDTRQLITRISNGPSPSSDLELPPNPSKEELQSLVQELKSEGLCGRRIAEQRLGPYFIASDIHGQREIELLDEILDEEYAGTDLCIETRQSECSRFRGGCKGSR